MEATTTLTKRRYIGPEQQDRTVHSAPQATDLAPDSTPEGWSARRANIDAEYKEAMAAHYVAHDFLVDGWQTPNHGHTVTSASIIVNPGTTPNLIVQKALASVERELVDHPTQGAPHIIWYTPGALIPSTLREARVNNSLVNKGLMRSASRLYLFPGLVDPDREMVLGQEAVDFIEQQQNTSFTYALLSAYAFDIHTGTVFFFFPEEVQLQKAVALRGATHKFLFLEPAKFRRDGNPGYEIWQLLESAHASVTIYTVASEHSTAIESQFMELANGILDVKAKDDPNAKTLRLVRVGDDKSNIPVTGTLRKQKKPSRL
jgi:hypothetical protein